MLPEPLRLLISSYAAGDLSPRRRKAAVRLLRHSAAARKLLRELRLNTRRLQSLPRRALPETFADQLVGALPDHRPIIQLDTLPRPPRSRWRVAIPLSLAAAIAAAGIGLILSWPPETPSGRPSPELARRPHASDLKVRSQSPPAGPVGPGAEVPRQPDGPDTKPEAVVKTPSDPAPAPGSPTRPEEPARDILGNTPSPTPKLIRVEPPGLLTLPLRGLGEAATRKKLQQELRGGAHHIDLFSRDTVQAFDRLQAALKSRGVQLVTEPVAHESLKRKQQIPYLVYCDDLTAREWASLLQALGTADQRAEDKHAGDGLFSQFVHWPLSAADQKELTALTGVDPSTRSRTGSDGARRPGPESSVANAPQPAPPSGWPAADRVGRPKSALVLPGAPLRPMPGSKEIKQFLEGQREPIPGTITVMLVLRLPNP